MMRKNRARKSSKHTRPHNRNILCNKECHEQAQELHHIGGKDPQKDHNKSSSGSGEGRQGRSEGTWCPGRMRRDREP